MQRRLSVCFWRCAPSLSLIYEKRVKVSGGLGGITMRPGGGLRCVVRFLISDTEEVLRVARQGGGAECWNAWREFEP